MACGAVTVGAADGSFLNIPVSCNLAYQNAVAVKTIVLEVGKIFGSDSDRLGPILKREGLRVVPAVSHFSEIFFRKGVRHVTVIARRGRVVAGLDPGIKMLLHYVAVHARSWVIAQVRNSFGVIKSVPSKSCRNAYSD